MPSDDENRPPWDPKPKPYDHRILRIADEETWLVIRSALFYHDGSIRDYNFEDLEPAPMPAHEVYAKWRKAKERSNWFSEFITTLERSFPWLIVEKEWRTLHQFTHVETIAKEEDARP